MKNGIGSPTYELEVDMADGNAVPRGRGYPPTHIETAATPPQQGPFTSRSPWAGVVTRIEVEPGQHVERGDLLLVLETMKIETDITAPLAGRVRAVNVAWGDGVKANQILVEFK
jgi:biotin carboxyl carrier protein